MTYFNGNALVNLSNTSGVTPKNTFLLSRLNKEGNPNLGLPKGPSIFTLNSKQSIA